MYVDKYINMCMPLAQYDKVLIFKLIFEMSDPLMSASFHSSLALEVWLCDSVRTAKTCTVAKAKTTHTGKQNSVQIECVLFSLAGALCST